MRESTPSDGDLLEQWVQGEARAGNVLVKRYFDEMSRFFRNKVRSEGDITELVAETFAGCTSAIARFRGETSFRRFLYSIANNKLLRYIEKQYKRERERENFLEVCVADLDRSSASSIVMGKRETRAFVQALREIPVKHQILLELMYFSGLSGSQIAERLGLAEGTIRGRIRAAKKRLRERIAANLETPANRAGATVTYSNLRDWSREIRLQEGWPPELLLNDDDDDAGEVASP